MLSEGSNEIPASGIDSQELKGKWQSGAEVKCCPKESLRQRGLGLFEGVV